MPTLCDQGEAPEGQGGEDPHMEVELHGEGRGCTGSHTQSCQEGSNTVHTIRIPAYDS